MVDDDATVRELTRLTLQTCGAIVTDVGSARDAVDVVRQERPDVLLADLSMPGEDGYWLIHTVRALSIAHGGGTPSAALTEHVTAEDRAHVLRAGFQFHIAKPYDAVELIGIVAILALKQ